MDKDKKDRVNTLPQFSTVGLGRGVQSEDEVSCSLTFLWINKTRSSGRPVTTSGQVPCLTLDQDRKSSTSAKVPRATENIHDIVISMSKIGQVRCFSTKVLVKYTDTLR